MIVLYYSSNSTLETEEKKKETRTALLDTKNFAFCFLFLCFFCLSVKNPESPQNPDESRTPLVSIVVPEPPEVRFSHKHSPTLQNHFVSHVHLRTACTEGARDCLGD
jgi:hypothetical protein